MPHVEGHALAEALHQLSPQEESEATADAAGLSGPRGHFDDTTPQGRRAIFDARENALMEDDIRRSPGNPTERDLRLGQALPPRPDPAAVFRGEAPPPSIQSRSAVAPGTPTLRLGGR